MARFISAPSPTTILVANLRGSGDPSAGRNPTKLRTGFQAQVLSEVPRGRSPSPVGSPKTPGTHAQGGLLQYTVPDTQIRATGTITVIDEDFSAPATLYLGDFSVTSGEDYDAATGSSYVGEDITNTATDGVIVIWKTAGAGMGEGTINVPLHVPIEPGTLVVNWTSGAAAKTQTVNIGGVFSGDGNAAGSTINVTTGALVIDTTGDAPDAATTITLDYTAAITTTYAATFLAAAIDGLPQFSAVAVGAVVTVSGISGPNGDRSYFKAEYRGSIENFTLSPTTDFLAGAEPYVGPATILT